MGEGYTSLMVFLMSIFFIHHKGMCFVTVFSSLYCVIQFIQSLPWVHITRITSFVTWIWVLYQSYPGLKALLFKERSEITTQDRNDAWVSSVAMMVIFFNLRWYVNVSSDSLFSGIYVFCTMVAIARVLTYKSDRLISEGVG